MDLSINSKSVLVTGVSGGLGLQIAMILHKLGVRVTLMSRNKDKMNSLFGKLQKTSKDVAISIGYVESFEDCSRAVSLAIKTFGRLDAVINNAGSIEPISRISDIVDDNAIINNLMVNLAGPIFLTSLTIPYLRKTSGTIVNISSGASERAIQGLSVYSAAKSGLNQFTKITSLEEPGITIISVRPGKIDTNMQQQIRDKGRNVMEPQVYKEFLLLKESGLLSSPFDVAKKVVLLSLFSPKNLSGLFVGINDEQIEHIIETHREIYERI